MNFTARPLFLGGTDLADVRLVHGGVDVHVLVHLGGDDEQLRRLERGGHGLAGIDLASMTMPSSGADDARVAEVGLGIVQRGLGLVDGGLAQPLHWASTGGGWSVYVSMSVSEMYSLLISTSLWARSSLFLA